MNRDEFDSLYYGKAVHCDTEEKANDFLALADSFGYTWISKSGLINYSQWERYEKETCYELTKNGLVFAHVDFFKDTDYQIVDYQPQPKFKVGDGVRVKNTLYLDINGLDINGKVGVIERVESSNPMPYIVKIYGDDIPRFWCLTENQLEKAEAQTREKETINSLIEEIKENQKRTAVLLNRLEQELKTNKRRN